MYTNCMLVVHVKDKIRFNSIGNQVILELTTVKFALNINGIFCMSI